MIPSVNFHLWEPCNMRCKFCYATFQDVKLSVLPKGHLPREQAIEVVLQLAEIGFEKSLLLAVSQLFALGCQTLLKLQKKLV